MPLPLDSIRLTSLRNLAKERYGEINVAEDKVLRFSTSSDDVKQPEPKTLPTIHAAFLRWLATDKDAARHIDPLGIRVAYVVMDEILNLDFCELSVPLRFFFCDFHHELLFRNARAPALYFFVCSSLAGVTADGLVTTGSVYFREFSAEGEISLLGAQIGGDLDCEGATLKAIKNPIIADGAKIGRSVYLRNGFSTSGTVRLLGVQIGGDLDCTDASISASKYAISADNVRINGDVLLKGSFSSSGELRFPDAQIGGTFDCTGADISELICTSAHIAGNLIWIGIRKPGISILRLTGATVTTLHDERASWPYLGNLHILDLSYQNLYLHEDMELQEVAENNSSSNLPSGHRLAQPPKLRAEDRIDWLKRQPYDEIDDAQPWILLSKLLDSNGDSTGAKLVLYEYHRLHVQHAGSLVRVTSYPYHRLEQEPFLIAPLITGFGIFGAFLFWRADRIRAMAPTGKDALSEFENQRPVPAGYPPFNPIVYALENVLPVVRLGQDSSWAPNHLAQPGTLLPSRPAWLRSFGTKWRFTRWLFRLDYQRLAFMRWVLIIVGWASALILAAAIGSRFKE